MFIFISYWWAINMFCFFISKKGLQVSQIQNVSIFKRYIEFLFFIQFWCGFLLFNELCWELLMSDFVAANKATTEPKVPFGKVEVITSKILRSPPWHGWPLWNICVTNDHGYVPLVVNTSRSFPHSRLITRFVARLIRLGPLVEQELGFVLIDL